MVLGGCRSFLLLVTTKRTHETQHGNKRKTDHFFKVLRKFNSKFDCLVYHMLYIKDS